MRDYAKISPAFWTGQTGRQLRSLGTDCQLLALYLITCHHATMLGLYYLPLAYITTDTGLATEGACKGLTSLSEVGFCKYDATSEWVFVVEMARFQVLKDNEPLKVNDKRVIGIQREYSTMPNNPFLLDFFNTYSSAFYLNSPRKLSPLQAPSMSLRSQEQEQEHKTLKASGAKKTAPPPSGEHQLFIRWWTYAFMQVEGYDYAFSPKDANQVKRIFEACKSFKQAVLRACTFLASSDAWLDGGKRDLSVLLSRISAMPPVTNGELPKCRDLGIYPPDGVNFSDWKFWEATDES